MTLAKHALIPLVLLWSSCTKQERPAPPLDLTRGKELYMQNCVACHGATGDGKGPAAPAMVVKPRDFTLGQYKYGSSEPEVLKTITDGVPGTPMPSWSHIPLADREQLAKYVRSLKK